jgi:hypothetical protein
MHIERAHFSYRIKLELKSLYQHLDKSPTGQILLRKCYSHIQQFVQQGTLLFPYPSLYWSTVSELYYVTDKDNEKEGAGPAEQDEWGENGF